MSFIENKNKELIELNSKLSLEKQKLENSITDSKEELNTVRTLKVRYEETINNYESDYKSKLDVIKNLTSKISECEAKLDKTQTIVEYSTSYETKKNSLEILNKQLRDGEINLNTIREDFNALNKNYTSLVSKEKEMKKNLTIQTNLLDSVKENLAKLKKEEKSLSSNIDALKEEYNSIDSELEALRTSKEQLSFECGQLARVENKLQDNIDKKQQLLDAKIESLTKEAEAQLELRKQEVEKEIENKKKEINTLEEKERKRVKLLGVELLSKIKEKEEASMLFISTEKANIEKQAKIKMKETERLTSKMLSKAESDSNQIMADVYEKAAQITDEATKDVTVKKEKIESEIKQLEQEKEKLEIDLEVIEKENKTLVTDRDNLLSAIKTAQAEKKEIDFKIKSLNSQIVNLRDTIVENDTLLQVEKLRVDKEDLNNLIDKLLKEAEATKETILAKDTLIQKLKNTDSNESTILLENELKDKAYIITQLQSELAIVSNNNASTETDKETINSLKKEIITLRKENKKIEKNSYTQALDKGSLIKFNYKTLVSIIQSVGVTTVIPLLNKDLTLIDLAIIGVSYSMSIMMLLSSLKEYFSIKNQADIDNDMASITKEMARDSLTKLITPNSKIQPNQVDESEDKLYDTSEDFYEAYNNELESMIAARKDLDEVSEEIEDAFDTEIAYDEQNEDSDGYEEDDQEDVYAIEEEKDQDNEPISIEEIEELANQPKKNLNTKTPQEKGNRHHLKKNKKKN